MKILYPSRKFLYPTVLVALASVVFCAVLIHPAEAGYIVTLQQVGPDVVATGGGPIDLTGLSSGGSGGSSAGMVPIGGTINTGPLAIQNDAYLGIISGPTSFGSGTVTLASSGSGDFVGMFGGGVAVLVPVGYASGAALADTSTYSGATFATLGVTPGTYVWTWGTGVNQNFTLQIGAAGVPDSGSTFGLLFLSLAALFGVNRFSCLRLA